MDFESQLLKHRLWTLVSNGMKIDNPRDRKSYKKKYKNTYKTLLTQYQQSKVHQGQSVLQLESVVKSTSKISL